MSGLRSRRTAAIVAVAIVAVVHFGFGAQQPAGAVVSSKVAITYGNTLTWESLSSIRTLAAKKSGWAISAHTFPNTGLCWWNTWLDDDIEQLRPAIIGINGMSNPPNPNNPTCGVDADGNPLPLGSDAYFAAWRAELAYFYEHATASGARVVFFATPPVKDPTREQVFVKQNAIAKQLAASYHGVSYSNSARGTLAVNGKYGDYKTCLSIETTSGRCGANGLIAIRTLTAPGQAGSHLCPDGLAADPPWLCPTYSSGEFRFARAVVNTLVSPPKPILP